jgi:hypothetical protein
MKTMGYHICVKDVCVFYKRIANILIIVIIYVDDLTVISNSKVETKKLKEGLQKIMILRDLGNLSYLLGIQFKTTEDILEMSQTYYIKKVLKTFNMTNCKPNRIPLQTNYKDVVKTNAKSNTIFPYRKAIGALQYLSQRTRPDIAFAVNWLAQAQETPTEGHITLLKGVFRYLAGTIHKALVYRKKWTHPLFAAGDASLACPRSRTGYALFKAGATVIYKSQKQKNPALSIAEAELYAASECTKRTHAASN